MEPFVYPRWNGDEEIPYEEEEQEEDFRLSDFKQGFLAGLFMADFLGMDDFMGFDLWD
jgi:hypothetical protein